MDAGEFARRALHTSPPLEALVTRARALPFERRIERETKRFQNECRSRGIVYSEAVARRLLEARLSKYDIKARSPGKLRIFAAWVDLNAETQNFRSALESCGCLRYLDMSSIWRGPRRPDSGERARMNAALLERFGEMHREVGVDVVFTYLAAEQLEAATVETISDRGVPTVNLHLDDDLSFGRPGDERAGVLPIASSVDLCLTPFRHVCERYLLHGAIPLWLPQGANPDVMKPLRVDRDIDVSFFGQRYGMRPLYISWVERRGVKISCFGRGWEGGFIDYSEANRVINRSKVNLGFAGRMFSERVVGLKGRDFEVPMAGGLYLTQRHPDLGLCYREGEEIVCYSGRQELLEQIQNLLGNPSLADEIRQRGWARARRDHTWQARFRQVFETLGVMERQD